MDATHETKLAEIIPGYTILDTLSASNQHVVYRAAAPSGGEVAIKIPIERFPRKEDVAAIRREFLILQKLQFEGVICCHSYISFGEGSAGIVMEKFGISLREYLSRVNGHFLPLRLFFSIAIPLARSLGGLHERKVIHKDITPANILIDPDTGETRLIDFSSSTELSREHQDVSLTGRIIGSLPYMSPEQTGRMNRDVDYRTDYYSLGITFFQMLTGQLPFTAEDPLQWVHCHISRQPPAAHKINRKVPKVLSDIIAKLISKNAEDRYQSSFGIITDLEKCQAEVNRGFLDFRFELAQADVSGNFQVPQKLFGRGKELERLELHFDNAASGSVEFCLVSGYPGVGKSVLVHELGRSIVRKRGFLIHGKFEQFKQNIAYAAFANAFRTLVYELLGEPKDRLEHWSRQITGALGNHVQLIIDLIPEVELITGRQPPVQELSPAEAQNRFLLMLQNFVKVFATADHPLVIFLDDLQWSDVPTLNLVHRLVTTQELGYLLIIGAYRDNAVDATHPLTLTLGEIQNKRFVENLHLLPLDPDAVNQLIMSTVHCDVATARPLCDEIVRKTAGNPYFTIELLKYLNDRDIIHFEPAAGKWNWDLEAVRNAPNSDNVVDFLVASQSRLEKGTQQVLQLAACIGAVFDLRTLSIIRERSMEDTAAELQEALRMNLVIPLSEDYKFIGMSGHPPAEPERAAAGGLNPSYRFQHDRVQQAAYSMIEEDRKQSLHLSIGRLILRHVPGGKLDDFLLDIVGHLNKGRLLLHDPSERHELAQLNLNAGIKAKQSSAYASALGYLETGYELLDPQAWQSDYPLAWSLGEEIQHATYLTGDWAAADKWTGIMLRHARTPVEKGLVLSARTRQYATIGKMKESMQAAREGLSVLGFEFLHEPSAGDVAAEVRQVEENRKGKSIESLIDMPDLTDERAKIASQLLMETFPAAFLSGSGQMFPYLVLKSVNLALRYGNSPETAFAYAAYGMLLCGLFEDTAQGYEYGKLGVSIIEKFDDLALKSRILYVYTMFVHHWSNHWSTMTPWFRRAIEAGYQSGDLLYLAYSAQDCIIWDPQLDLETASREQRKLLQIVRECEYQDSYDSGTLFLQMQLNFRGLTKGMFDLDDDSFDETTCVTRMRSRHFMTGIANYQIYKAEIHLLYNDAAGAKPYVEEQEKMVSSVMSLPQLVRFYVVAFLVYAALLKESPPEVQASLLEKMRGLLAKISQWARQCPENFEHLRLLMEAELAAGEGKITEALVLYEQSLGSAKKNGFIRDEAMTYEMAAHCLLRAGLPKAAQGYLQAARYLYYRWGAARKVGQMDALYPAGAVAPAPGGKNPGSERKSDETLPDTTTTRLDSQMLDISSVFKASQTLSGELVLDKLLRATLQILLEIAGAQKGCIVEDHEGQVVVLVQHEAGMAEDRGDAAPASPSTAIPFPVSLVNTSLRTREVIVLDNGSKLNPFSSDPYIIREKPLSVMCIPLPLHDQWNAAVYLENNLTHSAFSAERVKIIKLLAGQAAISMANARIYEDQKRLLKAQQRFVPSQFLKNLGHEDISRVALGESVSMEMSVLFSDVRDFTALVERLSPHDVIELLNEYYSALGIPIAEAGGFIDSYAGDEIMALFPVPAQHSVAAGVNMCNALRRFNLDLAARGRPRLNMGIGMNTGPLVLGTMGGLDRMQCSVLGDTVNLASRIEQLTKAYGARFLIGENTHTALADPGAFSLRLVDYVAVKGKADAIRLYEVLDAEDAERRAMKEATRAQLASGIEAYLLRDFAAAGELFTAALHRDPLDPVLSQFAERAKRYLHKAPPQDWQGYEKLLHK